MGHDCLCFSDSNCTSDDAWIVPVLHSAQLPCGQDPNQYRVELHRRCSVFVELLRVGNHHAMVHRKHRISSHPSLECKDSFLSIARSDGWVKGTAESRSNIAKDQRNHQLLEPETLGYRSRSIGPIFLRPTSKILNASNRSKFDWSWAKQCGILQTRDL